MRGKLPRSDVEMLKIKFRGGINSVILKDKNSNKTQFTHNYKKPKSIVIDSYII